MQNPRVSGESGNSGQPIRDVSTGEFLSTEDELEKAYSEITAFIKEMVIDAGACGAVVAMSGGIDSTLTAMLTADALGSDRVLGLGLPCNIVDSHHTTDARTIAEGVGIEFQEINLKPLLDIFEDLAAPAISPQGTNQAIGNAVARLRMICMYYAANTRSRLVVGTSNRSELLLGYFTKYGDGAADLYPIGELYKTEVRRLAQHIGVPQRVIHRTPTAGLWHGQTDEEELGASYTEIDQLLQRMSRHPESVTSVSDTREIDKGVVKQIVRRYLNSGHKRTLPPRAPICGRSMERSTLPRSNNERIDSLLSGID